MSETMKPSSTNSMDAISHFRLGVSLSTLDPDQSLETIHALAGTMVKAVELWEPTFEKSDRYVADARRAFEAVGVEPRTVHANFGRTIDIASLDNSVRVAGIQSIGVALDLAERMGSRIVIVHSGCEPVADDERTERIRQAKRSIATLAEMARQVGLQIAIELLPRTCLGRTAEELLELVEDVDPGIVGVCLDTNHIMNRFASLPDIVRKLSRRLIALHCSDYDGVDERHWPPLRGVIDWSASLASLVAVGFTGPLNYEANFDGQTPAERLALLENNFSELICDSHSVHHTEGT